MKLTTTRKWRIANSEKYLASAAARGAAWRAANRDKLVTYRKTRYAEHRKRTMTRLYRSYGLDEPGIAIVLVVLGRVPCEKCGRAPAVAVDHCHKTATYRGLLCHKCNLGIGLLGDTLEGIKEAEHYLERPV